MMSLDNTLWLGYIVIEAVVFGLLIYKRVWRTLPVFSIYIIWDLISNVGGFISQQIAPSSYNPVTYFIQTIIDSTLQFGILVELMWSVLRPVRASLSRWTLPAIAAVILLMGAAIWPFAILPGLADTSALGRQIGHLQQTVTILRILFFLGLAACSQLLSMGFRDRELQVASGLGFYSLVSLGTAMLSARDANTHQYKHLNQFVIASFLCSLLYWVYALLQKEAKRREFTPQMENLLLAVAGAARANRSALRDAPVTKNRNRDED